jgi:antitoxin ParD1/3/4
MATMNISLPDAMKAWVEEQAKTGRYSNASDYVRDLIRQDEEDRKALEWLQAEVEKGFEGPPPREIDRETFMASLRERAVAHLKS